MTSLRPFRRLAADRRASAAAEMALVLPLLTVLMFGSIEMGNYFMGNHIVAKAVRDGARFAARLPMSSYPTCTSTPSAPAAGAETNIINVVRTGDVDGDQTKARLGYWAATMGGSPTVTVRVVCDNSGTYSGIYKDLTVGAPVVTVTASVPYPTLFGLFGMLSSRNFSLRASSQAAVMGI